MQMNGPQGVVRAPADIPQHISFIMGQIGNMPPGERPSQLNSMFAMLGLANPGPGAGGRRENERVNNMSE